MRIDSHGGVPPLGGVRRAASRAAADSVGGADRADLSRHAAAVQIALQALQDVPDVREETVADLRAQVDAGAYTVDADALAARLLGNDR